MIDLVLFLVDDDDDDGENEDEDDFGDDDDERHEISGRVPDAKEEKGVRSAAGSPDRQRHIALVIHRHAVDDPLGLTGRSVEREKVTRKWRSRGPRGEKEERWRRDK